MNIEFGCGESPTKAGFKTCDIRNVPGVDFVCPAWEINKHVDANSVDEIFSRHFFEHLTFPQGEQLLQVWFDILKPGGTCEIILPNMTFHIQQWVDRSNMAHAKAGFWGWQREGLTTMWDVHKSGYDDISLKELLLSKGYVNIVSCNASNARDLHMTCRKP